ncbi:RagB/SusD family nutrient uptake outer membrane protein [Flavobacterium algicola]|uniref:RagB/SusD family nutrient uptake outer membrane protein n=1 Tax=Flavobacterium algicola TaxID=556529 RepID=UPI001EFCDF15|nr:RagB/SusD family nutrient uptake outer membrane protein [Flavobacterium algicola]MCG9794039.1 RagB/SusD family nutrient uptake outer membrane protein [Flavobacterium algicola]
MNTIKKYISKAASAVAIVSLLATVSCEDYLDEQPSTSIDSGYVYTTEEGLKSGVVSLYTFNRDRYDDSGEDYMGGVYMSSRSDLAFSRSGYTGLVGRYERGVSSIDLGTEYASRFFWKPFYKIANKATDIINAAEKVEGIEDKSRNQIIAEAKFFRAYSYFYLYKMYHNIFVTTESYTVENAFTLIQDKSSEEEIFALLNSDLQFAIDNLEWNVTFGRVSKGTAKHVKAQVAMWQGNWEEAKTQALSVIEDPSSPHKLLTSTADVFKGSRNHTEQLFVVQAQDDILGGGGTTMINANYVTQYFQITGIDADVAQGGRGFSRVLPNNYLLNLLAQDPNDTRDDNTYFRLKYYYNTGADTGKEITIYQPKATPTSPDGTYALYYQRLHPSCIKFTQDDDDATSYLQRSNILVLRLAETYLIAAEAILRSGSGDPLPYINAIRTRAKAAALTSLTLQDILDENARELAFEGERWFTLKRFGATTLNTQMRNYSGDGAYFPANFGGSKDPRINWQDYYINFAIFQEDLNLLGPNYPQNTGY